MLNENLKYSNFCKEAIETFIKNGDKERAEFWYSYGKRLHVSIHYHGLV